MDLKKVVNYTKRTTKDTGFLLKNTFALIGKNLNILKPMYRQLVWTIASNALLLIFVLFLLIGIPLDNFPLMFTGILGILVLLFFFLFLLPFVRVYYRAAQSWIVYQTLVGEKATYEDGKKRAGKNKMDIFWVGFFTVVVSAIINRLRGQKGILGFFLNLLAKGVEEAWDLLDHYLLPASIIEEDKTVFEEIKSLKNIKNNIPGALTGVFGIDFAGGALGMLVMLGPLALIGVSVVFTFVFGLWWLLLLSIYVYVVALSIYWVFVGSVKNIYFSIFYVMVSRPTSVQKMYQEEMMHYLNFEEVKPVLDSAQPEQTQPVTKKTEEVIHKKEHHIESGKILEGDKPKDPIYETLKPFFEQCFARGIPKAKIIETLVTNKWDKTQVEKYLQIYVDQHH